LDAPKGAVKSFVSGAKWHGHLGRVSSRAGSPCHRLTANSLQPPKGAVTYQPGQARCHPSVVSQTNGDSCFGGATAGLSSSVEPPLAATLLDKPAVAPNYQLPGIKSLNSETLHGVAENLHCKPCKGETIGIAERIWFGPFLWRPYRASPRPLLRTQGGAALALS